MAAGAPPDEPPFDFVVPDVPPEFADFMTPEGAVGGGLLEKDTGIPVSKPGLRGRLPGASGAPVPASIPKFDITGAGPSVTDLNATMRAYDGAAGVTVKSPEQRTADVLLNRQDPKEFSDPIFTFFDAIGLGDTEFVRTLKNARQRQIASNRSKQRDINTQIDHVTSSALIAASVLAQPHVAGARLATRAAIQGGLAGGVQGVIEALSSSDTPGTNIAAAATIGAVTEGLVGGSGAASYARQSAPKAAAAVKAGSQRVPYGSISQPLAPFAVPGAQEAVNTAKELGVRLMPDKLVDSGITGLAGGIARSSVGGGGRIARTERRTSQVAREAFDATLDKLPNLPREQVMDVVGGLIDKRTDHVKGVARAWFQEADAVIGRDSVSLRPLRDAAKGLLPVGRGALSGEISPIIKQLAKYPDQVSFVEAQRISTYLGSLSRQSGAGSAALTVEAGHAAKLNDALRGEIDAAIARAPAATQKVLQDARKLWGEEVKGVLSEKFIRKLATSQPEDVVDAMLVGNNVGHWRDVREILEKVEGVEGPAYQNLQGVFMRRVFQKTSDTVVGEGGQLISRLNPDKFIKEMGKLANIDNALLQEVFPTGNSRRIVDNLIRYANVVSHNEKAALGGAKFTMSFNFAQAGAIGTAMHFTSGATELGLTGAILLGPIALARVMTGPASNWLSIGASAASQGAQSGPGRRVAARATLAILGDLVANNLLSDEETAKAQVILKDSQRTLGMEPTGVVVGGKAPIVRIPKADLDSVRGDPPSRVELLRRQVEAKQQQR